MRVAVDNLVISVSCPTVHASGIALSRHVDLPYRRGVRSARRLPGQASMAVLRRNFLRYFKYFLKEYIFKDMFFNYSSLRETAGDIPYAVCTV